MQEISKKRLTITSNTVPISTNPKSGKPSYKWLEDLKLCIRSTFFIEISNVQTFFAHPIESLNLEILMCLKSLKEEWQELKQAPLTTQALKYGTIDLMMPNVMFGHLVVLYMKWQPSDLHLERITLKNSMLRFKKAFMNLFQDFTLMISDK